MKSLYIIASIYFASALYAHQLLDLAEYSLQQGEYYHAITECMRYQYCYPNGEQMPRSLIIMAKAYFLGGNYHRAIEKAYECYHKYHNSTWGEYALYNLATMQLLEGSPFFAYRNFQEYFAIYPNGQLREHAQLNSIYAKLLLNYRDDATYNLTTFIAESTNTILREEALQIQNKLQHHLQRDKKSLLVSLTGSIVIPGFGHFYAGNVRTGVLSFLSTITCAALAYRAYTHTNNFQCAVFAFAGFIVYQYSLISAIINVYEYNSDASFKEALKLTIRKRF